METKNFYKHFVWVAGIMVMVACNPPREAGIRDRAGNELSEFRDWVSNAVSRADDATEEERASLRQEFSQLSSRIAEGLNDLSDEARTEFDQLTARYEEWDAEQERKMAQQQQQQQTETVTGMDQQDQMTEKLLSAEYRDVNSLEANQIHAAYQSFMENVRENRENWTEEEWGQAEQVIERLNARREQLSSDLSAEDLARITTMQTEFRTMKTGEKVEP